MALARFLAGHPKVRKVNYRDLRPTSARDGAQAVPRVRSMLSFYTHTPEQATRLSNA